MLSVPPSTPTKWAAAIVARTKEAQGMGSRALGANSVDLSGEGLAAVILQKMMMMNKTKRLGGKTV
jgi:hypothetical protein